VSAENANNGRQVIAAIKPLKNVFMETSVNGYWLLAVGSTVTVEGMFPTRPSAPVVKVTSPPPPPPPPQADKANKANKASIWCFMMTSGCDANFSILTHVFDKHNTL
jgi:hypothetical protein